MNIFSDILLIKDAPSDCDVVRSAAPITRITIIYIIIELFKIYIHNFLIYYYYFHSIILLYIYSLVPNSNLTNIVGQ